MPREWKNWLRSASRWKNPFHEEQAMKTLFVNIKCKLGSAYNVAMQIAELDGVSEVYSISGEYDLLAKCYIPREGDEGRFVIEHIQMVEGVQDTSTIIAFNAFS